MAKSKASTAKRSTPAIDPQGDADFEETCVAKKIKPNREASTSSAIGFNKLKGIPLFLHSKDHHQYFSKPWFKEMAEKDEFWSMLDSKISRAVKNKRLKTSIECGDANRKVTSASTLSAVANTAAGALGYIEDDPTRQGSGLGRNKRSSSSLSLSNHQQSLLRRECEVCGVEIVQGQLASMSSTGMVCRLCTEAANEVVGSDEIDDDGKQISAKDARLKETESVEEKSPDSALESGVKVERKDQTVKAATDRPVEEVDIKTEEGAEGKATDNESKTPFAQSVIMSKDDGDNEEVKDVHIKAEDVEE